MACHKIGNEKLCCISDSYQETSQPSQMNITSLASEKPKSVASRLTKGAGKPSGNLGYVCLHCRKSWTSRIKLEVCLFCKKQLSNFNSMKETIQPTPVNVTRSSFPSQGSPPCEEWHSNVESRKESNHPTSVNVSSSTSDRPPQSDEELITLSNHTVKRHEKLCSISDSYGETSRLSQMNISSLASGKSSLMSWPDVKLIPQTNKLAKEKLTLIAFRLTKGAGKPSGKLGYVCPHCHKSWTSRIKLEVCLFCTKQLSNVNSMKETSHPTPVNVTHSSFTSQGPSQCQKWRSNAESRKESSHPTSVNVSSYKQTGVTEASLLPFKRNAEGQYVIAPIRDRPLLQNDGKPHMLSSCPTNTPLGKKSYLCPHCHKIFTSKNKLDVCLFCKKQLSSLVMQIIPQTKKVPSPERIPCSSETERSTTERPQPQGGERLANSSLCINTKTGEKPPPSTIKETGGKPPPSTIKETGGKPPPGTIKETGGKPPPGTIKETGGKPPPGTIKETGGKPPPGTIKESKVVRQSRKHIKKLPQVKKIAPINVEPSDRRHDPSISEMEAIIHADATETLYGCSHCGKCFDELNSLKVHNASHTVGHGGTEIWTDSVYTHGYTCPHCGKLFNESTSLTAHMSSSHLGKISYKCPHCARRYGGQTALKIHITTHTGEEIYTCLHCCKTFPTSSQPDLCPFCCEQLGQSPVGWKSSLCPSIGVKNLITSAYTGCESCIRGFTGTASLENHLTLVHGY